MDHKQNLVAYIQAHINYGTPIDTVRQQLIGAGWDATIVDEALQISLPQPPVPEDTQPKSTSIQASREKYGILQALKDAYEALTANIKSVIIFTVISTVLPLIVSFGMLIIAARIYIGNYVRTMFTANPGQDVYTIEVILLFAGALMLSIVFSVISFALIGLATRDGAEGKKPTLKATMLAAIRRTPRLLAISMLYLLVAGMLCLVIFLTGKAILSLGTSLEVATLLSIPIPLAIWVYLLLRFALLPTVALFESRLGLRQLYHRTNQLMAKGGMLFYFKLWLIGIVLSLVVSQFKIVQDGHLSVAAIILNLAVTFAAPVAATALSVVFYRNRLIARG